MVGLMADDHRFQAAIAEIDAANADDPNTLVVQGQERPKELAHAERMTHWVTHLDPKASPEQLMAARAHHLRRWTILRSEYPEGRAGYLRWRTDLSKQHAADAAVIMRDLGFSEASVSRVETLIRKQGIKTDPAVQTHEDALCLVFLETQFDDVAGRLGREKTVDVVAKTLKKMSPAGLAAAGELPLSDDMASVLNDAVALAQRWADETAGEG
jgi:hypothetical protein